MKQNNAAGTASNELLRVAEGSTFIGKNRTTSRELRRKREREAKRERIRDLKEQKSRGIEAQ